MDLVKLLSLPKVRVAISALLSAVTWFLWAYWANIEDTQQALISGLSQGTVNFFTTALGTTALEYFYSRFGSSAKGKILSILMVSTGSLLLMVSSHVLAKTPNIFLTVFPVYCVVVVFCSAYMLGLDKVKKQNEVSVVSL